MAKITYTALREIEEVSYSISGTDISASGTDDSFNAAATNLSGLLNDQWIEVSGFTDSANNGWFQASGASTASKITQDTTAALVTESAGPTITIQGHVRGSGQSYDMEFSLQSLDPGRRFERRRKIAIGGGVPEVLLHRREKFWNFKTDFIEAVTLAQWEEFFASIAAGETFTFDPYGTIAAADDPVTCVLEDDAFSIARVGTGLLYEITAQFRVIDSESAVVASPAGTAPPRFSQVTRLRTIYEHWLGAQSSGDWPRQKPAKVL